MPFPKSRSTFVQLLGAACVECGEKRLPILELARINPRDPRKINLLLKEKGVESRFDELKESFQLLCLNCKGMWNYKTKDFRVRVPRERKEDQSEVKLPKASISILTPQYKAIQKAFRSGIPEQIAWATRQVKEQNITIDLT